MWIENRRVTWCQNVGKFRLQVVEKEVRAKKLGWKGSKRICKNWILRALTPWTEYSGERRYGEAVRPVLAWSTGGYN